MSVRKHYLALPIVAVSALLGGGEVDLGVCWEGMAKDGEGKGLVVLRIFTSDDGEAGLGWEASEFWTSVSEGGGDLDEGLGWKGLILMVGFWV